MSDIAKVPPDERPENRHSPLAVHWLGAGLSSTPGLVRLANSVRSLSVWDRDLERARNAVRAARDAHPNSRARAEALGWKRMRSAVRAGDVIVSMLPGEYHARVARLCVDRGAHFVCSSYLTRPVEELHREGVRKGLCLVNEVGLDPGIDHLFAHDLFDRYRESAVFSPDHRLSFRSYCGGLPQVLDAFRYRFSWSPAGVLKALRAPARWIDGAEVRQSDKPWQTIRETAVPVASGGMETFEAYPNRDSLPFRQRYGLDPSWNVDEFVRGTLRPHGWSDAWRGVFAELDALDALPSELADARLHALSDDLWTRHACSPGEADRVVLSVELEVRTSEGQPLWHKRLWLDERGDETATAMARLVSWTVSLAVEDVIHGRTPSGVQTTPAGQTDVTRWIEQLETLGVRSRVTHGTNSIDRCVALQRGVRTLFAPRERRSGASAIR